MNLPDHPDPERVDLAFHTIGTTCTALAAAGCDPVEVATALASMLGVVVAAIDCCEEHAAQAEEVVVEIFEDSLATHRIRYAAWSRVGEAGMIHEEGHA